MKYGSSVKIEVKGLWDNTPLFSRQLAISSSPASRDALEEIKRALDAWFNSTVKISALGKGFTDEEVLALAKSRGLIPQESKLADLSELYFVDSRSGKTNGHYIERYRNGTVTCICPGFVNNGKCWASTGVSTSPDQYILYKWAGTKEVFDTVSKRIRSLIA